MELDRIDRKIVSELMRDATIPVARLAAKVGLSQTPCWKRLQRLQEQGVIRGRVAVVDPVRLGYAVSVYVGIEAPDQSAYWHADFAALVQTVPQILQVHRLAGAFDYLLQIATRDLAEYDAVCRRLTDAIPIRNLTSHFAVETVKQSSGEALILDVSTG